MVVATGEVTAATRRSILLLSLATFASSAGQRICDAMLPELSRVFGVTLGQAAQVISVFAITYGIAQLCYGPLGDRLGKYSVITWTTWGCCIGSALAIFAGSLDVLLIARFLMALSAAAIIPLAMAWVGDSVPTDQMQEMLTRTGLGTTLGLVAGQLAGGMLTDALGWRACFVFITLLFGIVGVFLYGDLCRQQQAHQPHQPEPQPEAPVPPTFVKQALIILTGKWSRVVLLLALVEGAAVYGALAIYASHLHLKFGLSLSMAGAVVALFGLGGMIFMVTGRQLIRRFGQQDLVLAGGVMIAVGACTIGYTPHWLPTVPASVLAGFGFFMFHNTMQANATSMAPDARGTAVSLFASVLFLGQSVGVGLLAWLLDHIGSSAIIALGGVVMALEGAVFFLVLRQRDAIAGDVTTPQ